MINFDDLLNQAKTKKSGIDFDGLIKQTPKQTPVQKTIPRYSKAGEETVLSYTPTTEDKSLGKLLPRAIGAGVASGAQNVVRAVPSVLAASLSQGGTSKRYEESNQYQNKPVSKSQLELADKIGNFAQNISYPGTKIDNFISQTQKEVTQLKTPGNRILAQGAMAGGQIAPAIATGLIGGAGLGMSAFGTQVYGGAFKEALDRGSDTKTAGDYALGQTILEVGTETLSGGIPGLGKGLISNLAKTTGAKTLAAKAGVETTGKLLGKVTNTLFNTKTGKVIFNALGEGAEEVIAEKLSPYIERATIDPNADDATLAQLAESFVSGALLSTVLQGGSIVLSSGKNISKAEDVQKLDPVEKQEFNSILEQKAYESNVRKGKITPNLPTMEGWTPDTMANVRGLPARSTQRTKSLPLANGMLPKPATPKIQELPYANDIRIVNGETFYKDKGATTAPIGQSWFTNGKSRFDKGERKSILLPEQFENLPQAQKPIPRLLPKSPYSQAKGQREMPRAIFPAELPRAAKTLPEIKPIAPTLPKATITKPEVAIMQKAKQPGILDDVYTRTVDNQYSLGRATKNLPMAADKDIKIMGSNARNVKGTVEYVFRNNLVDMEGKALNKAPLEELLNTSTFEQDAYNDYLLHKHNIARYEQHKPIFEGTGVNSTITAEQSRKIVAEYEKNHLMFSDKSKNLSDFNNKLIDEWTVKSGLISKEFGEWLKKTYPDYVPTIRMGGVLGEQYQTKGLKANAGIKKATGGNKPIMPIVQSYPIMVQKVMKAARQNELYNALLETVQKYPQQMSKWAKVVEGGSKAALDADLTKISKQGFEESGLDAVSELADKMLEIDTRNGIYYVTAMKNGKPVRMEVDKRIFDSFKSLTKTGAEGTLDQMADYIRKHATNPFKALITGYNPFFAIRNIARDIPTSYVFGTENNPFKWMGNLAKATKSAVKKDEAFQEYEALGGKKSGFFNAEKGLAPEGIPRKTLRKAGEKIQAFNELTETIPRYGEYIGTVKREGGDYAAKQKGIYNSGEVTVNFNRSGDVVKSADAIVPYLNPGVQGIDKSIRALSKGSTWAKGIGVITVPAMVLYAINNINPDDRKNYQKLDNRTKDTYFVIPTGDGKYIKLPKSRELGVIFGTLFERLTRAIMGDADSFEGFKDTVMTNFAPTNPIESNILSPAVLNLKTNKDFAGRAIVPMSMSKEGYGDARSKYLQYDETTSEIAKWFGQASAKAGINDGEGFSPKQVQYLIDSYTGVVGDILLPATTKNGKVLEKVLTRPFTADVVYNNSIQNDFYEKYDEAKREKSDNNLLNDIPSEWVTPEDKKVSVYTKASIEMSALRKKEKEITANMKDGESKENALRKIRQQILDIAFEAPKEAERIYNEYKSTYIPELSMMSEKQIEAYNTIAKPLGATPKQYYNAYAAQKEYTTSIGKGLALNKSGYTKYAEAFDISNESLKIANALSQYGLDKQYNLTYGYLKGASGSEEKKKIIDFVNPKLSRDEIILLYEAFDVSQGVGRYQRQFN